MLIDLPGIIGSVVSFVLKFLQVLKAFFSRTCMDLQLLLLVEFYAIAQSKF